MSAILCGVRGACFVSAVGSLVGSVGLHLFVVVVGRKERSVMWTGTRRSRKSFLT
jgi:hypothetical protein